MPFTIFFCTNCSNYHKNHYNLWFFICLGNVDEDGGDLVPRNLSHHGQSALSLFPSSLCSAIVQIITLLDDPAVSNDGNAVYEVAYHVRLF